MHLHVIFMSASTSLHRQAQHYWEHHDYDAALRCAERALERETSLYLLLDLSQWHLLLGHYDRACELALRAQTLDSSQPLVHERLATAYLYLQETSRSITHGKQALGLAHSIYQEHLRQLMGHWTAPTCFQAHRWSQQLQGDLYATNYLQRQLATLHYNLQTLYFGHLRDHPQSLATARQHSESRFHHVPEYRDILLRYPYWRGEILQGQHLVILPEQGIGDEILHAETYQELIEEARDVTLLCERRLEPIFKRTFSTATVIAAERSEREWLPSCQPIHKVVLGLSTHYHRRSNLEVPRSSQGWITLDSAKQRLWQQYRASLPKGYKIGIAWRSRYNMSQVIGRHEFYYPLEVFQRILCHPKLTIVNLQYDQAEEEICTIEQRYGCRIHRPPLDLLNDIDDVIHLIANLDACVTPENVLHIIGAAIHKKTYVLKPDKPNPPIPIIAHAGQWLSPQLPSVQYFHRQHSESNWNAAAQQLEAKLFQDLQIKS